MDVNVNVYFLSYDCLFNHEAANLAIFGGNLFTKNAMTSCVILVTIRYWPWNGLVHILNQGSRIQYFKVTPWFIPQNICNLIHSLISVTSGKSFDRSGVQMYHTCLYSSIDTSTCIWSMWLSNYRSLFLSVLVRIKEFLHGFIRNLVQFMKGVFMVGWQCSSTVWVFEIIVNTFFDLNT